VVAVAAMVAMVVAASAAVVVSEAVAVVAADSAAEPFTAAEASAAVAWPAGAFVVVSPAAVFVEAEWHSAAADSTDFIMDSVVGSVGAISSRSVAAFGPIMTTTTTTILTITPTILITRTSIPTATVVVTRSAAGCTRAPVGEFVLSKSADSLAQEAARRCVPTGYKEYDV
jgi:hypothetical protein